MVQQQLANLQTSFQQQIAALGATLGASTNLNSSTMNFDIPSSLPMYLENPITSFHTLPTANYFSGSIRNSIGLLWEKS